MASCVPRACASLVIGGTSRVVRDQNCRSGRVGRRVGIEVDITGVAPRKGPAIGRVVTCVSEGERSFSGSARQRMQSDIGCERETGRTVIGVWVPA